ncbi:GMC oxidoreductase [Pseudobacteriovorax antillogorgiicola]|uniref:Choline dehydrogenase n=1 Tax=Pseudobacteriovorax antillogorgiicola TaxID=1513793 RepID=A0A1Y6CLY1_9BACT|nr:GMC family oxidoreductase [Pseudobacteriovorax antillogorgiicola]TCS45232.1 choline dehydrogenase-like flavoprotein [Pseudobacteriovorax antillogorgiicola]SMF75338.1 Choline dehydrogenase [Pseudobacteriovorax antillogorgiicola]
MLVECRNLDDETWTDICIIGSGLGGGTLALQLANTDSRIFLIEAGNSIRSSCSAVQHRSVGRAFKLNPTRAIEVGGTSNLWHGVLAPLDEIDFQYREWIPHSGWPIKLSDLKPWYDKAGMFLGIKSSHLFDVDILEKELGISRYDLPIVRDVIDNKVFQQPQPVTDLKSKLMWASKKYSNFTIVSNAVALELKSSSAIRDRIDNLEVGCLSTRITKKIRANIFIVCAGALESPRLLLNSCKFKPGSKYNKYNNIGAFLMDHPMGNLVQVKFRRPTVARMYSDFKGESSVKVKSGIVFRDSIQRLERLPNHNFYVRPSFKEGINNETETLKLYLLTLKRGKLSLSKILKVIFSINLVLQILVYKLSLRVKYRFADLFFVTEQVPSRDSYVSLSHEKDDFGYPIASVNWNVSDIDLVSMEKSLGYVRQIFSDRYFEFVHEDKDIDWKNSFTSAAHHVGTLRMAKGPEDGVVDKNLKVFGLDNLYVCDGSVFPTSGNVNSGLTIVALAFRLARYLRGLK